MGWTVALLAIGTGLQAYSMYAGAKAQEDMADVNRMVGEATAAQMERQAGQERAASHRAMIAEREKAALVGSRARVISGASGAGVSDASVTDLLGDIDREGEIRALSAMYQGEEIASGLEYGAQLERAGAAGRAYANQAQAAMMRGQGLSTLMQDASYGKMLYDKYNPGLPPGGYYPDPNRPWG